MLAGSLCPLPPLHWAVHSGAAKDVRSLLKAGCDIRAVDEAGNTALGYVFNPPFIPGARAMYFEAAPENQVRLSPAARSQVVRALLSSGADSNALHCHSGVADPRTRQPSPPVSRVSGRHPAVPILLAAACCNDAALLALLLRAGANPHAALPDGRTALDLAYLYGCQTAIVVVLQRAGAQRTRPDTLAQCARRGDMACLSAMLRQGIAPDTPEPDLIAQRAFHPDGVLKTQTIHGHQFPAPRTLLEFPIFPLMQAVAGGQETAALTLLDAGADPVSRTMREAGLLGWAARQGMTTLCSRLIDAGWDPNGSSGDMQSPLSRAAGRHAGTVRLLLQKGASPDGNPANVNDFPLSQAVAAANVETAALLLTAGAAHRGRDHRKTAALKGLKHANASPASKAKVTALFTGGAGNTQEHASAA